MSTGSGSSPTDAQAVFRLSVLPLIYVTWISPFSGQVQAQPPDLEIAESISRRKNQRLTGRHIEFRVTATVNAA